MPLHLITGPAHSGKTAKLLKTFRERLSESPVLLVPTAADVRAWRRLLLSDIGILAVGRVETFGSFTLELHKRAGHEQPILTGTGLRLVVEEVIAGCRQRLSKLAAASERNGFAGDLLKLFLELESAGFDSAALAQAVREAGRSLVYGDDISTLFEAYQDRLAGLHMSDSESATQRVITSLREGQDLLESSPLFLHGFSDLTPAESRLLKYFASSVDVYVTLTYEAENPFLEYSFTAYDSLRELSTSGDVIPLQGANPAARPYAGEPTFLSAGGRRAEIELIGALVAREIVSGTNPGSIGVIVRSIAPYRALIAEIFDSYGLPHSILELKPIKQTSIGHAFTAFLRFFSASPPAVELRDLLAFARSPYSSCPQGYVDQFDHQARRQGATSGAGLAKLFKSAQKDLRVDDLVHDFGPDVFRDPAWLLPALDGLLTRMWATAHGSAMMVAGPGSLLAEDAAALNSLRQALAEISRVTEAGGFLAPPMLISLLDGLDLPAGDGDPETVRIVDALNCGLLRVETAFIAGLNQQEFPRLIEEEPFFSDRERQIISKRQEAALPLRNREQQHERYLFYQAVTRSHGKLFLSSRYCDDDGRQEATSFFVQDIRADLESSGSEASVITRRIDEMVLPLDMLPNKTELLRLLAARNGEEAYRRLAAEAGLAETIDKALARQSPTVPRLVQQEVLVELSQRTEFSATELESYLACPFKWFVEHAVRPTSVSPDSPALLQGRLAHDVLAKAVPKALAEPGAITESVERLVEEALSQTPLVDELAQFSTMRAMLTERIADFLVADIPRLLNRTSFQPAYFEKGFGTRSDNPVSLSETVTLSGRVDRIDVDDGSHAFVIDYKTGASTAHSGPVGEIDKNRLLQVLLYSMAASDVLGLKPVGAAYHFLGDGKWKALLSSGAIVSLGDNDKKSTVTDDEFAQVLDRAKAVAIQVVADIRSGKIQPDPAKPEVCSYCEKAICRV